jgi:hypothetical protein
MEESTDQINKTTNSDNTQSIVVDDTNNEGDVIMISETNTTEITKQENISIESNENNNTTDTSFDSSGKKLRRRTVNRGLDGNYWGKIEMLVETKPKRKRKTVERLYVGDAVLNIEDDEDTKDTDDKKSETRLPIEDKKERPQSSNRKIFYKQKTFIAVRNESSMFNLNLIIRKKRCLKEF